MEKIFFGQNFNLHISRIESDMKIIYYLANNIIDMNSLEIVITILMNLAY